MASPVTQVQIHQRSPAGRLLRTKSRTTSATAHPAVPTAVTSWSFASRGGGGAGRTARSRVSFTPSGYEVRSLGRDGCARFARVMYLIHAPGRPAPKERYSELTSEHGPFEPVRAVGTRQVGEYLDVNLNNANF